MKDALVNICMITYNHGKYIAQAIESVLMQQTSSKYELIIGEDCSTDETREIVISYAQKYPDKIKAILHPKNIGAKQNVKSVYAESNAKYVALLEGDDYWTDPNKLQKQIEFLESNEDYVMCTHSTECINDNNNVEGMWFEPLEVKEYYLLEDFISYGRTFIATSSVVSRNYLNQIHEWYHDSPAGDMAFIMSMCLQKNGKIKRFNECMSAHRNHKGGAYSGLTYLEKQLFSIETRIFLRSKLPKNYEPAFKQGLRLILSEITSTVDNLTNSNSELNKRNEEVIKDINHLLSIAGLEPKKNESQNKLRYKSYKDLSLTINKNISKIPRDIDLIVGVPRSGMLPATIVAQILNKPVVALDSYLDGKLYEMGHYRRPQNLITDFADVKKVLIIDDSINSGGSMIKLKERIAKSDKQNIQTIYSAVYYVQESLNNIDIGFEECAWPRIFQWNILNSWILSNACVDIDGVVCMDPTNEENDDGELYKNFLLNAKPLFLTEFPISCFVTSRLEKYRPQTEEWFKKHNLNYKELIMLDLPSREERLRLNNHASFKAEVYKNRKEELFIESNISQARKIAELTGKLVFLDETMEMIEPVNEVIEQLKVKYAKNEPTQKNNISDKENIVEKVETRKRNDSVKRVMFVNHNLYPFEISGTPISTLNHALGMNENNFEVAVLIPSPEVNVGFKRVLDSKYTIYKLPRLDKYATFLGEIEKSVLNNYLNIVDGILAEFLPDVIHINDYVYMPEEMITLFHSRGIVVIRNVCNLEEICHMDYPVVSKGLQGMLCSGPDSAEKCAECYLKNKLDRKNIDQTELQRVSKKIQKRFDSIQNVYNNNVDGIIFTEQSFEKYFRKYVSIDENKTQIIPRGFKFNFERRKDLPTNNSSTIRFAFIGNVMFSKGADVVLKAFEQISNLKNFHLDIYGTVVDNEYSDWIKKLEKDFSEKIKYYGVFEKGEIDKIAERVDVAIVPSYFDTYNRVVRECFYFGIPIIATNFFGSSIISNNVNGLKFDIGDHKTLASLITNLVQHPEKLKELREGVANTSIPSLEEEINGIISFHSKVYNQDDSRERWIKLNGDLRKTLPSLIAFYLPQYHPIPENDAAWGEGFTEWTNVKKAKPLFNSHYQPHEPADLGYYDLRMDEVRKDQIELAKKYGIKGFCYYYYWFNGKQVLETPIKKLLANKELDFPFCVCWANENWTRKWDGHNSDIILEQNHNPNDDKNFIQSLLPYFKDDRYIKVDGKPLLIIYRTELFPDIKKTSIIWRNEVKRAGLKDLYLVRVESFTKGIDPVEIGFDAAVEFAPDWSLKGERVSNTEFNSSELANLEVYDYKVLMQNMLAKKMNGYKLFRGVTPSWDNTARRGSAGHVFINSSPELYKEWLKELIVQTRSAYNKNEQFVFLNAWNEWAEGNHLEPDINYGKKYLEVTYEALMEGANLPLMQNNDDKILSTNKLKENAELKSLIELINKVAEEGNLFWADVMLKKAIRINSDSKTFKEIQEKINSKKQKMKMNLKWNSKKSTQYLFQAEKYIEKQNLEAAKKNLNTILNIEPEHVEALNNLAVVSILENNLRNANELLDLILKIDSTNEVALGNQQYLKSLAQENYDKMIEENYTPKVGRWEDFKDLYGVESWWDITNVPASQLFDSAAKNYIPAAIRSVMQNVNTNIKSLAYDNAFKELLNQFDIIEVPELFSQFSYDAVLNHANVVVLVYEDIYNNLQYWSNRVQQETVLTMAAHFVACSNSQRNMLLMEGVAPEEISIIPLQGVDLEIFKPRDVNDPDVQSFLCENNLEKDFVLFVGRLTAGKGLDYLIKATEAINKQLVLIGQKGDVDVTAFTNIKYLGVQNAKYISKAMSAARVLALPSIPNDRWLEQWGRVVPEALACGLPSVVSDIGGLRYTIKNGVHGFIVNPADVDGLINALKNIYDDEVYLELVQDCIRDREKYGLEEIQKRFKECYVKVLKSSSMQNA